MNAFIVSAGALSALALAAGWPGRDQLARAAVTLAVAGAVGTYALTGSPQLAAPADPPQAAALRREAHELEAARRFGAAAEVYRRLAALDPTDPNPLLDQAVATAMDRDEKLAGEPERLIDHALQLAPRHVQALALSGSARLEAGDRIGAVKQWRLILEQVPDDSELAARLGEQIAQAERPERRTGRP